MEQKEIEKCLSVLSSQVDQIVKIMVDVANINPDEPIGVSRLKMVSKLRYAQDTAKFTELVLADDPYSMYIQLREICE